MKFGGYRVRGCGQLISYRLTSRRRVLGTACPPIKIKNRKAGPWRVSMGQQKRSYIPNIIQIRQVDNEIS